MKDRFQRECFSINTTKQVTPHTIHLSLQQLTPLSIWKMLHYLSYLADPQFVYAKHGYMQNWCMHTSFLSSAVYLGSKAVHENIHTFTLQFSSISWPNIDTRIFALVRGGSFRVFFLLQIQIHKLLNTFCLF